MGKLHSMVVNLRRGHSSQPWGLSLVGGSDVGTPLIITKVNPGAAADGQLFRGDVITKIGDYDARDIRHEDAENLFRGAGNSIKIAIQRDTSAVKSGANKLTTSRSSTNIAPLSPLAPINVNSGSVGVGSPNIPYQSPSPAYSNKESHRPYGNLPHTVFPVMDGNEMHVKTVPDIWSRKNPPTDDEIASVTNQPYRTTPLVLPGAKAKHEPTVTESYLRHHPNPSMRQTPHLLDHEILMRQRVADTILHKVVGEDSTVGGKQVVHKQFNSPIGLYSEPNIVNTIKQQTGVNPPAHNGALQTPIKMTPLQNKVFDPSRSEALRALQEEQDLPVHEVSGLTPKVFTPPRVPSAKKPAPPPQANDHNPYLNSLGEPADMIHQSGSFKRLMYHVLGQTDY